jgi:hypothetical protein
MDGRVTLPFSPVTLMVKHPWFISRKFTSAEITDKLSLIQNKESHIIQRSSRAALSVIKNTLNNKKNNKESTKQYYYKSYNKFSVSPDKRRKVHKLLNLGLKLLNYNYDQFQKTHLFLMESVSETFHEDKVRKKERIIGIKSTGIQLPSTYTSYVHPNPFPLYENYISIANSKYISPLCKSSYVTYAYKVVDTAVVNSDTIFTLRFYPLPGKSLNAIRGLLYINSKNYAVQYFTGGPLNQGIFRIEACQEYRKIKYDWFPYSCKTEILLKKFGPEKMDLTLSAHSFIFDYKPLDRNRKNYFNEYILEYDTSAYSMPDSLWNQFRQDSLTEKDKATFNYFDSTGIQKRQENFLRLGERIYFGIIPIGYINLDLNRIINTNYREGLRLGLGGHTSRKFSEKWKIGAYVGYGFKDEKWKYGTDVTYTSVWKNIKYTAGVGYNSDIYEAGAQFFPFDLYQYSSEPLRKYRLSYLDYIHQFTGNISIRPLKYLNVNAGFALENHEAIYNYSFRENPDKIFNFTEFSAGFRYAFGEEYIRTPEDNFYLGTSYPVLWINLTQGVKGFAGGEFNYSKFDIKVQQTFKFFRFGTTGIQLLAGIAKGSPPYPKLYNMRGSLRDLSVVIHNSFETMQYNEFLSDRFFALFYSHDFGQLYTPDPDFRPNLVMVHNLGFGNLKNREYHTMIPYKIMDKGYFESGIFLKNLIVLNLSGLRTGFGLGLFARYGPYAHSLIGDNLVFKLSTNFIF